MEIKQKIKLVNNTWVERNYSEPNKRKYNLSKFVGGSEHIG